MKKKRGKGITFPVPAMATTPLGALRVEKRRRWEQARWNKRAEDKEGVRSHSRRSPDNRGARDNAAAIAFLPFLSLTHPTFLSKDRTNHREPGKRKNMGRVRGDGPFRFPSLVHFITIFYGERFFWGDKRARERERERNLSDNVGGSLLRTRILETLASWHPGNLMGR